MSEHEHQGGRASLALRPLLLALGIGHAALGALMVAAPRTFFEEIGPYAPYNDHYIRDVSTFYLAMGAAFLIATARRSWQVPVLGLAFIQYLLHVLNHVWDVSDADPAWLGPVNLITLGLTAAAILWGYRTAQR